MSARPSLPQYLGIGLFLTVLAVFVTFGQARGVDVSLEFLGFVLAFSAIHVALTYRMIQRWVAYATDETTSVRRERAALDDL
jgi:hypothetical protein